MRILLVSGEHPPFHAFPYQFLHQPPSHPYVLRLLQSIMSSISLYPALLHPILTVSPFHLDPASAIILLEMARLLDLPNEVLLPVLLIMPFVDATNLSKTCSRLFQIAELRWKKNYKSVCFNQGLRHRTGTLYKNDFHSSSPGLLHDILINPRVALNVQEIDASGYAPTAAGLPISTIVAFPPFFRHLSTYNRDALSSTRGSELIDPWPLILASVPNLRSLKLHEDPGFVSGERPCHESHITSWFLKGLVLQSQDPSRQATLSLQSLTHLDFTLAVLSPFRTSVTFNNLILISMLPRVQELRIHQIDCGPPLMSEFKDENPILPCSLRSLEVYGIEELEGLVTAITSRCNDLQKLSIRPCWLSPRWRRNSSILYCQDSPELWNAVSSRCASTLIDLHLTQYTGMLISHLRNFTNLANLALDIRMLSEDIYPLPRLVEHLPTSIETVTICGIWSEFWPMVGLLFLGLDILKSERTPRLTRVALVVEDRSPPPANLCITQSICKKAGVRLALKRRTRQQDQPGHGNNSSFAQSLP